MTPQEIRNLRATLNLTQTAFGELIGVALRTVQDYEAGKRKPGPSATILLKQIKDKSGHR